MASKEARIAEIESLMENDGFWSNQDVAQKLINENKNLKNWTIPYRSIKQNYEDIKALLPDAYELKDEELMNELLKGLDSVDMGLEELEVKRMLSGDLDNKNCYLTINSGAGGTEACDWVQMLFRMYQRWASKHGWKIDVVDFLEGDVVGYKNISMKIEGDYAYGYAKAEKGVHRLVRISPFDSNAKRHTSFASVDITPEIEDDIEIDVHMEDIRVDTYRASGAGGQHVNKTDSAVRMTHLPTGIVVSCQAERSQIQNRETCLKMLRSKLYELELEARKSSLETIKGEKKEIAWGSQIRNYVLQPYTLVTDTRTNLKLGNVQAVLDGEIDEFIYAYLKEFGT